MIAKYNISRGFLEILAINLNLDLNLITAYLIIKLTLNRESKSLRIGDTI